MQKKLVIALFLTLYQFTFSQIEKEIEPPFNIKTVSFTQNGATTIPFFRLGESFNFQFDDLYGNEADYYYIINQCNYDWSPSQLAKSEYLNGVDNQRIMNYKNSYNTLQQYSHYTLSFPNRFNSIIKSGNYILKIFNDEQELVFSRKFIIYEDNLSIAMSVRRSRDFNTLNEKQNIELAINYGDNVLQNPKQNVNIALFQNGNFKTSITKIKPQYTIGTELIYRYNDETQFWGGNEFYTFDTSNIRITNNSVAMVTAGDIYNSLLYTNEARKNKVYTYFPDFNGIFYVKNVGTVDDLDIESDYTWVYFSLSAPDLFSKNDIYINGMFNNYTLNEENKMVYNKDKRLYEKAILVKQGYVNYQYVIANSSGKIDYQNAIDGNFYLTENQYDVVVYYRGNNERYDRVIGKQRANSENIRN